MKINESTKFWVSTAIATIALISAIATTYWSYQCRYYGVLCENSVLAPDNITVLEQNSKKFNALKKIHSENDLEGIQFVPSGYWLFGYRIDVVANFKNSPSLIVDSIDDYSSISEELQSLKDGVSIIAIPNYNGKNKVILYAYYFHEELVSRKYKVYCYYPDKEYAIELFNIAFDKLKRKLIFDVEAGCYDGNGISVNGDLKTGKSNFVKVEGLSLFASNIELKLSDNYHVVSISSQFDKNHKLKLNEKKVVLDKVYNNCILNMKNDNSIRVGSLYTCDDATFVDGDLIKGKSVFHKSSKNGFRNVAHFLIGSEEIIDSNRRAVLIKSSWSKLIEKSLTHQSFISFYDVSLKLPVKNINFIGDCSLLEIDNFRFNYKTRDLELLIQTTCDYLSINGIKTELNKYLTRDQNWYTLKFDDRWLPIGLQLSK